ncbi:MAG TPA: hypothetical protein ACHBX0_02670 [Arsenophonus sp.]
MIKKKNVLFKKYKLFYCRKYYIIEYKKEPLKKLIPIKKRNPEPSQTANILTSTVTRKENQNYNEALNPFSE